MTPISILMRTTLLGYSLEKVIWLASLLRETGVGVSSRRDEIGSLVKLYSHIYSRSCISCSASKRGWHLFRQYPAKRGYHARHSIVPGNEDKTVEWGKSAYSRRARTLGGKRQYAPSTQSLIVLGQMTRKTSFTSRSFFFFLFPSPAIAQKRIFLPIKAKSHLISPSLYLLCFLKNFNHDR